MAQPPVAPATSRAIAATRAFLHCPIRAPMSVFISNLRMLRRSSALMHQRIGRAPCPPAGLNIPLRPDSDGDPAHTREKIWLTIHQGNGDGPIRVWSFPEKLATSIEPAALFHHSRCK